MLAAVDANRARLRDLDHPVLRAADDDHHRAVRADRHQAATLESADHHRQQEASRSRGAESRGQQQGEDERSEKRYPHAR